MPFTYVPLVLWIYPSNSQTILSLNVMFYPFSLAKQLLGPIWMYVVTPEFAMFAALDIHLG